jgi:hypothetical protein
MFCHSRVSRRSDVSLHERARVCQFASVSVQSEGRDKWNCRTRRKKHEYPLFCVLTMIFTGISKYKMRK